LAGTRCLEVEAMKPGRCFHQGEPLLDQVARHLDSLGADAAINFRSSYRLLLTQVRRIPILQSEHSATEHSKEENSQKDNTAPGRGGQRAHGKSPWQDRRGAEDNPQVAAG